MLSALYLKGVKQGDGQMTVLGLAVSALFYCASRSRPLRRLSATRPPARIFGLQACVSVLGQFAAHLASLLAVTRLCEGHVSPEDPSVMPDGPFRPNAFNSAVFLLSSVMQVGLCFGRLFGGLADRPAELASLCDFRNGDFSSFFTSFPATGESLNTREPQRRV